MAKLFFDDEQGHRQQDSLSFQIDVFEKDLRFGTRPEKRLIEILAEGRFGGEHLVQAVVDVHGDFRARCNGSGLFP
jgi:hypothetical protein